MGTAAAPLGVSALDWQKLLSWAQDLLKSKTSVSLALGKLLLLAWHPELYYEQILCPAWWPGWKKASESLTLP